MNENPGANSKIIRLTSENVKRIQVVEITPTGNVVVVAGKNGEGKTSVLDSIMYALGGAGTFAKQPVRQGAQKATIEIELDDLTVKRTITANGNTSLSVTKKDGSKYSTPQSILDGLVGKLSFDPLEFSRQKPEVQGETLRQIAGLDFEQHNQEVDSIFASRTFVNREVKNLEARLAAMPAARPNLPEEEQSTADVLTRQQAATTTNSENEKKRQSLAQVTASIATRKQQIKAAEDDIQDLKDQISAITVRINAREKDMEAFQKEADNLGAQEFTLTTEVNALKDVPLDGFAEELSKLEETNRQVRAAAERRRVQAELKEKRDKSDSFTKQISKLEELKAKKIREAKYPIEGLSVNLAGDVLFNDLPLEQASSAQQLRVSVAIGLALNPKLRVLLVRDGSLLDETSRKLLLELATEHDAQVWLEQVGTDGDVSVIIEDGMVKETTE